MPIVGTRYPVAQNGGELARRTAVGVLVSVVLAAVVVVVGIDLLGLNVLQGGEDRAMSPFGIPAVLSAIVAGASAAVAYAVLVRYTDRPARNFGILSAVVFLGMLVPVFAFATEQGAAEGTGQALLAVLHVAVAVPIVAFISGAVEV
jgi:drug/metabolite transporter (DMT)-like permease